MAYSKKSLSPQEKAVLTSIAYSDIFNFPLTQDELWKFFISENKISRESFEGNIQNLKNKYISENSGYFCLKGRDEIIKIRMNNIPETTKKLKIAEKAAYYLSHIKSVLFIGISGGLAMGDVEKKDDIDFFVITKNNTIFKSRLLIILILQTLGIRRKRQESDPTNKICVNFLIDEKNLAFPQERHDVYTAHEILQTVPLFEAQNIFHKFLESNEWIRNFYPNAGELVEGESPQLKKNIFLISTMYILNVIFSEKVCKLLQIALINKHRKNEIVTNHVLAFNPNDYRLQTLDKLRLKSRELGLLTKD